MAFIVSAAATAAVSAASAGAITTGVAGAISAGALGSAAAGIGAGAATGAAVGAGLGAGVSAIQGKDAGQGALMGAATGAIGGAVLPGVGGALNGVGQGAGQAAGQTAGQAAGQAAGQSATQTATNAATNAATNSGINAAGTEVGSGVLAPVTNAAGTEVGSGVLAPTTDTVYTGGNITSDAVPITTQTPLQNGIAQGSQAVNPGSYSSRVVESIRNPVSEDLTSVAPRYAPGTTPMMGENMTQEASAALAKQEAIDAGTIGQHGTDTGQLLQGTKSIGTYQPTSTNISGYVGKGIDWVKENPGTALIGGAALLPMLGGSGPNNGTVYTPDNTNYLSSNFQRTAPQGRVPVSGYASGGILSGMPGADVAKDFVGQISPSLSNNLFGNGPMNPIVARGMQQAQQAQGPQQQIQAQGPQQQIQAQGPQQAQQPQNAANGGIMHATDSSLGSYAHGGIPRLLRGPGDGVSDDIPATIAGKQPARLADGEFVIPARIVSELGNGSTEAGGRVLQAMVDRVQARRSKTVGKGKVAVDSKAKKGLPV